MNYTQALKFIETASFKGSVLGLSRIKELLELMGNPQNKCRFIHVSGTNGKGSFSTMITSILSHAGYKTGSFSSPALVCVNDCFRINCTEISDDTFAQLIEYIAPFTEKMQDKPTEFEILTAAAFELFRREKCDFAVVECGMGGDTDSTNVIENTVLSVITNVEKDHCGILGNNISEIAHHKAGIIKSHSPVLFGGENSDAEIVVKSMAEKMHSDYYSTDKSKIHDISYDTTKTCFSYGNFKNIKLSLIGLYQTENTANVLSAIEILRKNGIDIPDDAIYDGLENCTWKGRFEVINQNPLIIFDGSHNVHGMTYTVSSIKHYFKGIKPVVLIGVMSDKEYYDYGEMLKDCIDCVFTVKPDNLRALGDEELAQVFLKNNVPATPYSILSEGIKAAYECSVKKNVPLIAMGSLYMYKDFISVIKTLQT